MPEEVIMLEDLEEIVSNKYLAVNIAARRARQLNEGERPTIKTGVVKPSTIALRELVEGKLEFRVLQVSQQPEDSLELDDTLLDEDEPILEEEYIDDTDLVIDDEEPEEGL